MNSLEETFKRWTCPSDRELTLRAKIRAGWSSRATANDELAIDGEQFTISENEQAAIYQVLERANKLQEVENERIRKLNERLDKLKKQAYKRDPNNNYIASVNRKNCILCNEEPRIFRKFYTCKDCNNPVCKKCSVDNIELDGKQLFWLCKLCSESRELLKKTNQWTKLTWPT